MMLPEKYNKKLSRFLYKSLSRLHDKPLPLPTGKENELVEELKNAFRKLPVVEENDCSASEKEWINNANRLRQLILNEDPREFLRWHVISSSMFVKYAAYINYEYKFLKEQSEWNVRWSNALVETHTGHPVPYYHFPKSSANLIHHAYHLAVFEHITGINLSDIDFIFEFGGGYGSMCRLNYNLGFSGKYLIYDIPAFSALQEFYLKSAEIQVLNFKNFQQQIKGALCISNKELLEQTLSRSENHKNALFIATWSISETPYKVRDSILPLIAGFKTFLIAYQEKFQETDNTKFFSKWTESLNGFELYDRPIEHMQGNRYLMGRKKASNKTFT